MIGAHGPVRAQRPLTEWPFASDDQDRADPAAYRYYAGDPHPV